MAMMTMKRGNRFQSHIHRMFVALSFIVLVSIANGRVSSGSHVKRRSLKRMPSGFGRANTTADAYQRRLSTDTRQAIKHDDNDESVTLTSSSVVRRSFRTTPYSPKLRRYRGVGSSPNRERGYLSRRLIGLNIACFLLQVVNPGFTRWGANIPQLIKAQPRRYLTPIFLHGNISHLLMNSYSLFNIGVPNERILGDKLFLATYFFSGAVGNALSSTFQSAPAVGASGAIFGLVGAYGVFVKRNEAFFGKSGDRAFASIQRTTILNLALGAFSHNIDNWGHLGGIAGGAIYSYAFGPRLALMSLPGGGQVVVNRPIIQMPEGVTRKIDEIPEYFSLKKNQLMRKFKVEHHLYGLPEARRRRLTYRRYNRM